MKSRAKDDACLRTTTTWLVLAGVAVLSVGGCGRLAESMSPSDEAVTDDDASTPSMSHPPDEFPSSTADASVAFGSGCASASPARAGSIDGGPSMTTVLDVVTEGVRNGTRMLRNPYATGSFADEAGPESPGTICGDRGVYFADNGCGWIAFAACDEERDASAPRSCIYLTTNVHFNASERMAAPAGHFVDSNGQCWELHNLSVVLGDGGTALGDLQSGTFEATAVSGPIDDRIGGSFVACRAHQYRGTCK